MGRRDQRGKGADDVLRREDIGAGVNGIEQAHRPAQQIVPGEFRRAQILAAGIQQKNGGGHGHCQAQELTVAFEGIHIVQKRVQVDAHDEEIPAHIEDQKDFVKRDFIVQNAVHDVVALGRVTQLDQKIPQ